MIIIENATKKFGTQTVLNNVSLTLEDGKIYGFVGQNGCGKTVQFDGINRTKGENIRMYLDAFTGEVYYYTYGEAA